MRLHHIAINNLRRRKLRTAFLVSALVLGAATVVTLLTITSAMKKDMGDKFEGIGSKIIIKPKRDEVAFTYGPIVIASGVSYDVQVLTDQSLKKVESRDQINIVSPKLLETTTINNKQAMIVGIDFNQELKLKDYWSIEGQIPAGQNEVLIGAKVAAARELKNGNEIEIEGQRFRVSGIIETTAGEEDGLIFMDIKKSQQLFNQIGGLTFIEANVGGGEKAELVMDQVVQGLRQDIPEAEITPVKEAVDERKQLIDRFAGFSVVISVLVLLIGALLIMAAMISSVKERTAEIGIFRAIGFRKSHIIKIFLIEAGVISFLGSITGSLAGLLAAAKGASFATQMALEISWNPFLMLTVVVSGVLTGLLSSLYPAEALRFI